MARVGTMRVRPGASTTVFLAALAAAGLCGSPARAAEVLLLEDPLNGSTIGTREGGSFVPGGGWQAAAGDVRITYDLGHGYGAGRFEVDVRNFLPCVQPNNEKCQILSMFQSENQTRDSSDDAGESNWVLRTGNNYFDPCQYKLLTNAIGVNTLGHEQRIDTGFAWDADETYHFILTWSRAGQVVLTKRSTAGEKVIYDHTHNALFMLRYLLVGRDREPKPNYGEQPGVIYSNVRVFVDNASGGDLDGGADGGGEDGSSGDGGVGPVHHFRIVADTYASADEPATNFGADDNMRVGAAAGGQPSRISYLRFNVAGLTRAVQSAKVYVQVMNNGGGGGIHRVGDNAWGELTLTWNNKPAQDPAVLSSLGVVGIDEVVSFDVTPAVQADGVYSFAIVSDVEDGSGFWTRESGEIRPFLEVIEQTGPVIDGGAQTDTGLPEDAGVVDDSGAQTDTGVVPDTGTPEDTGMVSDAGVQHDTGVVHDAGGGADAQLPADAAKPAADAGESDYGIGCGCSTLGI